MIESLELKNFGPLEDIRWKKLGKINLIVGGNGVGKTFLLKAMYCAVKTLETFRRGKEPRPVSDLLADRLHWTFEVDRLGDLVRKKSKDPLEASTKIDGHLFSFKFGKETETHITKISNNHKNREPNSIFLPAKEVLSIHKIIKKTRDFDRSFGFDDTYYDLANVLGMLTTRGKNYKPMAYGRERLSILLGGRIEFDQKAGDWFFKQGSTRFPMGVTAEGIKKIGILDTLLGNRYLTPDSIVFIDEPDAALHPTAISDLLDIIAVLAEKGMQFFLATHSFFVVKKLYLIALQKKMSIPLISAADGNWTISDLANGYSEIPIIRESVRLYLEEVDQGI